MNLHKNARLTPRGRERIVRQVESGQTPEAVAEAAGVCPRTVRKWVDRYRREGLAALQDRSSRPHRLRQPTPQAVVDEIERLPPPALDRQADRRRDWRLARYCQPRFASAWIEQAQCPASRPNQSGAMNARSQASSSISISKSSAASALSDTVSPDDIPAPSTVITASAGSSSMSVSTMPRASRSCRCWPISAKERCRLPAGRRWLLRQARRPHRTRDD